MSQVWFPLKCKPAVTPPPPPNQVVDCHFEVLKSFFLLIFLGAKLIKFGQDGGAREDTEGIGLRT